MDDKISSNPAINPEFNKLKEMYQTSSEPTSQPPSFQNNDPFAMGGGMPPAQNFNTMGGNMMMPGTMPMQPMGGMPMGGAPMGGPGMGGPSMGGAPMGGMPMGGMPMGGMPMGGNPQGFNTGMAGGMNNFMGGGMPMGGQQNMGMPNNGMFATDSQNAGGAQAAPSGSNPFDLFN